MSNKLCVSPFYINADVVIIIMTITIIVVVRVMNVFLYIVIKKSCWTVTFRFESGLNFICGNSERGTRVIICD